jgi:hypothetical protein
MTDRNIKSSERTNEQKNARAACISHQTSQPAVAEPPSVGSRICSAVQCSAVPRTALGPGIIILCLYVCLYVCMYLSGIRKGREGGRLLCWIMEN